MSRAHRAELSTRPRLSAISGAVLLCGVAVAGVAGPVAAAGASTPGPAATMPPATSPTQTLTVPTAEHHAGRFGAVPRITDDVRGVDALGHVPASAAGRASVPSAKSVTYGGGLTTGALVAAGVTTGQPEVYLVFMGDQWGTESRNSAGQDVFSKDPDAYAPALQTLYSGFGTDGETWSGIMTQYCDGTAVGATTCSPGDAMIPYPSPGVLAGVWYDHSTGATTDETAGLTEREIATEAEAAATHFGNAGQASNRDAQYVIASPTGTDPDGWDNPVDGYCAYHDDSHDPGIDGGGPVSGPIIAFTNLPYVPDAGADCGAGLVNSPGTLDGATAAASHEYAETVTDQFPETDPVPGWIDSSGMEIADLCAYVTSGPGAMFNLTMAGGTVVVQGLWSNEADNGKGSCEDGEANFAFIPTITSVSPKSGAAGSTVTITGRYLGGATSVSFAGTPATVVTDTGTSITVIVPGGASNGTVSVVTPYGTATSTTTFSLAPTITSFAPSSSAVGGSVTIDGSGLGSARRVTVGGRKALVTSDTATQIVVTVPARATSGPIVVTTRYGTATSGSDLAIT
jgi:serine protease